MRDYTVHLLFLVLVVVVGFASGIAAGLYWYRHDEIAMWLAGGALAVGVLILILQVIYISGTSPTPPGQPRAVPKGRRRRGGTRPDMVPVPGPGPAPEPGPGTLVQPAESVTENGDEETKSSAAEALKAYQHRQTGES